ncbi:MAG: low molecular weight protein-tyrosine-phosphatase [Actinomycetes bacterium]
MVCTGNICRSPIAEAVLRSQLAHAGLTGSVSVASAGTGRWHVGQDADPQALAALERAGYRLPDHRARQFEPGWLRTYDLVLAMDTGNERALLRYATTPPDRAKIHLLRTYDPAASEEDREVADPYGGGPADFDRTVRVVEAACPHLVDELSRHLAGPSDTGPAPPPPGRSVDPV